ncbi:hypothetical protein D9615_008585 [Tricholomella constricta]|uniref:FAD/NAD(P)-binding domain-containing protein n=1 Tax=Tricholomella constricta TaxID=117010 RepID=A0A8H5H435_9AGAR|nr:hypothetical protein D9615_008585 [Tricholomella constricta]
MAESKAQVNVPWEAPNAPPFRHGADDDNLANRFEESLRLSREIDAQLLESKKAMEKKKKCVQILLLGQSESGKSSVLKNFQLAFAPKQFESERVVWKTIVQLNVIGSLKLILDVLQREWESTDAEGKSPLNRDLRRIRLGLSPLLFIEQNIMQLIAPGNHNHRDVCVRPGSNWKALLRARVEAPPDDDPRRKRRSQNPLNKEIDPTSVLAASKDDILVLWNDLNVRAVLKKRGVRMEDMPGFFLNDIERIAGTNYTPTDSDIMRARIRTLGVEEHYFIIEKGLDVGSEVYITDVGGSRSQRPKWIPYFEDVQTILFLAPLAFNQALEEDSEINRLKDVLSATLASGVKVKRFVPSYGDLPNEVAPVTKYPDFCDKFRTYHRKLSPLPRPFMFHETSAIDTSSMAALLLGETVRETILRLVTQHDDVLSTDATSTLKVERSPDHHPPIVKGTVISRGIGIKLPSRVRLSHIDPFPSRPSMISTKTVVVLGAAYGGPRAAQILAAGVPQGWRVLLIDRNSLVKTILRQKNDTDNDTDVYILPRLAVLPGHEHKAFIVNSNIFLTPEPPLLHRRLQATVTSISQNSLTLSKAFPEHGLPTETVTFNYLIYALGSHLPVPLNLWGTDSYGNPISSKPTKKGRQLPVYQGMKSEGVEWLKEHQRIVEDSPSILVVGGGALGIQFATDIAAVHPTKKVTLLHSRKRLLPRFDEAMHAEIISVLSSTDNIDVVLGERLDLSSVDEEPGKTNDNGQRVVRTVTGREIAADLVLLCTGQSPNTGLLKELNPATVNPDDGLAHVLRTMQLGVLPAPHDQTPTPTPIDKLESALNKVSLSDAAKAEEPSSSEEETTPYPHIFVIGDAADAFGAIPAGHNAYYQGEVAARNVIRLIKRSEGQDTANADTDEPLELYTPGPPSIKVSLGLGKSVFQSDGIIGCRDGDPDDLGAARMWPLYGNAITDDNDEKMYE